MNDESVEKQDKSFDEPLTNFFYYFNNYNKKYFYF